MDRLRPILHRQLDPTAWPGDGLSPVNRAVAILICIAVALAIVESEPTVYRGNEPLFLVLETGFFLVFLVEYAARVWVAAENPAYGPGWPGRLRYVLSPTALVDLLALSPMLFVAFGSEVFLLRLVRLVRILRLARLGRFSAAAAEIAAAVRSRRYELGMSLALAGLLLLTSATLLYVAEGQRQPESFGSIPRAMWWSIATLTTVGYGDVYPVTPVGKLMAAVTAVAGIGLIAMPAGILAAAFSDVLQKRRGREETDR